MSTENPNPINEEDARTEAIKIKDLLERRRTISPQSKDYKEAYQKVVRDAEKPKTKTRKIESRESKPIEKIANAVIFDWDGVLFDSMENVGKGVMEVIKQEPFQKNLSLDDFLASYEAPWQEYYERLGIPTIPENIAYIYEIYHSKIIPMLRLSKPDKIFPEIIRTLRDLKQKGLKIAIISAHKTEEIHKVLEDEDMLQLIDYLEGYAHSKVAAIKKFCEENNLDPKRVIMFGDLPSDIKDAQAAGVKTAAIARFEVAKDRLGSYDPTYLFRSVGSEIMDPIPYFDK